jgi:hypothetical protein
MSEIVVEINVETGERVERPPTAEELAQAKRDRKTHEATEKAERDRHAAIANASTVHELKLALGLPTSS